MNWCWEQWNSKAGIPSVLVHWAGWAMNRRCTDTALGHTDRGPTLMLDPLSNTDGGESVVGGSQSPVSGIHNGTASLANPTLSPTSESHKFKQETPATGQEITATGQEMLKPYSSSPEEKNHSQDSQQSEQFSLHAWGVWNSQPSLGTGCLRLDAYPETSTA